MKPEHLIDNKTVTAWKARKSADLSVTSTFKKKQNEMIVLVKYKEWVESEHWFDNGGYIEKSELVEVSNLLDLNKLFKNITDVAIIQCPENNPTTLNS